MSRGAFAILVLRALARLSLPNAHRLGAALGALFYWVPNKVRRVTATNLRLCFPAYSRTEHRRLLLESLRESGKSIIEVAHLWLRPGRQSAALVRAVSGEEYVQGAMAEGRGVILAAPHLGTWEIVGLYVSTRHPMTSLYRPPRLRELDALMRNGREQLGARLVPTDTGGVRSLMQALKRGELVGILPDQEPGPEGGVFAPFFGTPAYTMTLLSRLAAKTGARVILSYAERLPHGAGYHLHFIPAQPAVGDADPVVAATALNAAVEGCVRRLPAQYQWSYKRFKTRPAGEAKVY